MYGGKIETADICGHITNVKRYTINRLPYESLPLGYTSTIVSAESLDDIRGLPIGHIQNQQGYHPLKSCYILLELLNSYLSTTNPAYIKKAAEISDMFLGTGVDTDGALYFPYTSDFHLHGDEREAMKAPWYSGMTQGMALATYVRFYQATEDTRYIDVCRRVFRTFIRFKNDGAAPWTVYVDNNRYYWIEEYPIDPPASTLNGFIVGIFGLYEWYCLVGDADTTGVLQAAITTIERYLPEFRREGNTSLYCLKHKVQSARYHKKHVEQLNNLYRVTGDGYFLEMADGFRRDTTAVIKHFRKGWLFTLLTLLPPALERSVYSGYHSLQRMKRWRT